jgi:hypothetical protein
VARRQRPIAMLAAMTNGSDMGDLLLLWDTYLPA